MKYLKNSPYKFEWMSIETCILYDIEEVVLLAIAVST